VEPSEEVVTVIRDWFGSIVRAENSWRDRHVSQHQDLRIIGTDPGEWLNGDPAFAFLRTEADAAGGKVQIEVNDLEGFREGSVGWGCARPTITLPDGSKVTPRWSAVFHQEDGGWKVVQLHASVGAGNRETFGDVLPE